MEEERRPDLLIDCWIAAAVANSSSLSSLVAHHAPNTKNKEDQTVAKATVITSSIVFLTID